MWRIGKSKEKQRTAQTTDLYERCKKIAIAEIRPALIKIMKKGKIQLTYSNIKDFTIKKYNEHGIFVDEIEQISEKEWYIACHGYNQNAEMVLKIDGNLNRKDLRELDGDYREQGESSLLRIALGVVVIAGIANVITNIPFLNKIIKKTSTQETNPITVEESEETQKKIKDVQAPNVEQPQSSSDELSMCLIDPTTGNILFSKDSKNKMHMASTTKIMTAIVGLENCDDVTKEITVTEDEIKDIDYNEYSNMGLQVGEKISYDKVFEGVAEHSACEGCEAIAKETEKYIKQTTGKDVNFIDLMNKKAEEIGMKDSHFTNTYGASEENHYATTQDMCKLLNYCINQSPQKQNFREYFGKTGNFVKPATNKNPNEITFPSYTNNSLMRDEGYTLIGKTGYTDEAGQCWVFAAIDSKGNQVIGAIFSAANKDTIAKDVQELTRYGFKCIKKIKELTIINSPRFKNAYAYDEQANTVYVTPKQQVKEDEERG